jgi:micrococcal nuclease
MKQASILGGLLLAAFLAWPATSVGQKVKQPHSEQLGAAKLESPEGCDPSYPDVCIPPAPPDLNCGDIPHRRFRVVGDDPHRFDRDKDGIGCERN